MHFWVFLLASRGTCLVLYPDPHPEVEYQKDATKGFTSRAQTPPSSHEEKGSGVTSPNPWACGSTENVIVSVGL